MQLSRPRRLAADSARKNATSPADAYSLWQKVRFSEFNLKMLVSAYFEIKMTNLSKVTQNPYISGLPGTSFFIFTITWPLAPLFSATHLTD